jgi:hypothetical protein
MFLFSFNFFAKCVFHPGIHFIDVVFLDHSWYSISKHQHTIRIDGFLHTEQQQEIQLGLER